MYINQAKDFLRNFWPTNLKTAVLILVIYYLFTYYYYNNGKNDLIRNKRVLSEPHGAIEHIL